jgi:hypothetical protein
VPSRPGTLSSRASAEGLTNAEDLAGGWRSNVQRYLALLQKWPLRRPGEDHQVNRFPFCTYPELDGCLADYPDRTGFGQATTLAEGYASALGSAQLAGVLSTYADGWSIHRQRLIDDLSQEASLAETAVRSYCGTDEQLATALGKREATL